MPQRRGGLLLFSYSKLSQRELLLLHAALNPDSAVAAASWMGWSLQVPFEEASRAELRLIPAAFAHLYRVAPTLELPKKLRGKVRANFCNTTLLADGSLPIIEELSRHCPVMLTKGLAICLRFKAWASRPMVDVDIHVPIEALAKACQVLAGYGWTPRYGMTWNSLVRRSSLRRNSWNFTNGLVDVDLHWRLRGSRTEHWLERQMWSSGEQIEYSGRRLFIQSAEFALISALDHGFMRANRADALQTVVDSAWLLPLCKSNNFLRILRKSELLEPFKELLTILDAVAPSERVSNIARQIARPKRRLNGPVRHSFKLPTESAALRHPLLNKVRNALGRKPRLKRLILKWIGPLSKPLTPRSARHRLNGPVRLSFKLPTESAVLRHPLIYKVWNALGRTPRLERLILKWIGPFSKPLTPRSVRQEYDLTDCAAIDEIGGPGWAWPQSNRVCFWGDRADSRLIIPLSQVDDALIVIALAQPEQKKSPNGRIDVFANGHYATNIDKKNSGTCCVMIARQMLFGPWVELSFRPKRYSQDVAHPNTARSVAARRLRILDRKNLTRVFSGHLAHLNTRLLRGEEPYASKLSRIKAKIENSSHKNASELPDDFDPLLYVLSYGDLFEREVDPYEHFIRFGRQENRAWR